MEGLFRTGPAHYSLILSVPDGKFADVFQRTVVFLNDLEQTWRDKIHTPFQVLSCVQMDPRRGKDLILVNVDVTTVLCHAEWKTRPSLESLTDSVPVNPEDCEILEPGALLRCDVTICREDAPDLGGLVWNTAWILGGDRIARIGRASAASSDESEHGDFTRSEPEGTLADPVHDSGGSNTAGYGRLVAQGVNGKSQADHDSVSAFGAESEEAIRSSD
ncbi:hypothetical protein MIND_00774200 [Mycena indigotica]|uniref:Uncharacterized protein n=1 Tax=Mycena indigotica TaxID=2126181 RepID=A0A8H6SLQ7_9AGAR|nr:uncharacterized protein MIND_00774200 [Mycena indigotica]KAF7302075.1 hypothetical protein MIND_00774200 [Mycena indigotica]